MYPLVLQCKKGDEKKLKLVLLKSTFFFYFRPIGDIYKNYVFENSSRGPSSILGHPTVEDRVGVGLQ